MRIPFYKYQATGNDFVIINQTLIPYLQEPTSELVARICHRRFGIGADGLMLLERSNEADFKMIYYNSDGNLSTMCGNGGRAIVRLAHHIGLFKETCSFMAVDGKHDAEMKGADIVALKMNNVNSIRKVNDAFILDTGSPHFVQFREDTSELDIFAEAKKIRYSDAFKENGINVNFIAHQNGGLLVRTYERGVEDETYSCGTGVTAAALVAANQDPSFAIKSETNISTKGGNLKVRFTKTAIGFENIWLIGAANKVFEGSIEL